MRLSVSALMLRKTGLSAIVDLLVCGDFTLKKKKPRTSSRKACCKVKR